MFTVRRAVIAIALFFLSLSCHATAIFHEIAFQGGQHWTAAFTVKSTGTPSSLTNFSIFFDQAYASNLQLLSNPATWDAIVVQPDTALGSDGFLDALVLDSANALADGESVEGFVLGFDWSSTSVPALGFEFVISDANFVPIFSGVTEALAAGPQGVPEPSTCALVALALGLIWRQRSKSQPFHRDAVHLLHAKSLGFMRVVASSHELLPKTNWKLMAVVSTAGVLLAGCGGNGSSSIDASPLEAGDRVRALAAADPAVTGRAPTVAALVKESERRITRTVYEYTFVVQARNDSAFNRSGVKLVASSGGSGTTILQGEVQFAGLAAGGIAASSNRLVLRHDRQYPFDSTKLIWSDVTPTIAGKVLDGYIRGATIYWDCNGNRSFDPSEVSTVSGPGGAYTIDPVPASGCHLYAAVGADAVDEDSPNRTVGSAYQMAAVPASYQIITPYTTLVHGLLNKEPGLSVAIADDRLQKSIGFNCGSVLYDYARDSAASLSCSTAIKTAARLYRAVLQEQPTSMPYDQVVGRALDRMSQLVANPGFSNALSLGFVPFIYQATDYGALLRSLDPALQPKASNRLFTVRAGSSRDSEQVLRSFAEFIRTKGSVAYGYTSLNNASDAELRAQMFALRRAAEKDSTLANQPEVAAALKARAAMLESASSKFAVKIDDATDPLTLFTSDPVATADLFFTVAVSSTTMFVDFMQAWYGLPDYAKDLRLKGAPIEKVRRAMDSLKGKIDHFEAGSKISIALGLWTQYAVDPTQQTSERFAAAVYATIEATLQIANVMIDAEKNGLKPVVAMASLFNSGFQDRNEQFRLLLDLAVFHKEIFAVGLEGSPIGSRLIAGIDFILQPLHVYFAGQDLAKAAADVQDQRVADANKSYQEDVAKAFRDYYLAFIQAFYGNFVIVDTATQDFVDKVTAQRGADGVIGVTLEGAFRMSYLPSLGGAACSTATATTGQMVYLCPGSVSSALFDLNTVDDRSVPGAPSWIEGGPDVAASRLAAGGAHTCAFRADGNIACWGYNFHGQLGDGSTTSRSTPATVQGLTGVTSIAAGLNHNCAIRNDGTVACWGWNENGQLGDGSTTNRSTPLNVQGLTGIAAVLPGANHTCALKSDGSVACWGFNSLGQLGDGSTTNRLAPVTVQGLTGVKSIAVGRSHSCALRTDGSVACWGYNIRGQLGDGTRTSRSTPVTVPGLTTVTAIAASGQQTCAIKADGSVACWGENGYGQLGDGTTTDRLTPVSVLGLTDVVAIHAGHYYHVCALRADGRVACWGANYGGALGDGTAIDRWTPVTVQGLTGIKEISAGGGQSCALKTDMSLFCWGRNITGALGDGTTTDRLTPVRVLGF